MKLFICGFMGAGKTYLLNQLKKEFYSPQYQYVDLDNYIANKYHFSNASELINSEGMVFFREAEYLALLELDKLENLVVSLGGGSLNKKSAELLKTWQGFWLDTDFKICLDRINNSNRPLAKLSELELEELYKSRLAQYKAYPQISLARQVFDFIHEQQGMLAYMTCQIRSSNVIIIDV